MKTRLTIFKATLVQDSALSVSGLERDSSSDQSFTVVDGVPVLLGRGLKGAAVALARRFFEPLPSFISEDRNKRIALQRSAWEFENARPLNDEKISPELRSGVGIRHKTGARAPGILFDREVIAAGTQWKLEMRVDERYVANDDEFTEAEGMLGYVLSDHWVCGALLAWRWRCSRARVVHADEFEGVPLERRGLRNVGEKQT